MITSSREEILEVARLIHRPVAAILVEKTIEIMKAIFLLEDSQASAAALDFLTSLLEETSTNVLVAKDSLVRSHLQMLLGEIITEMGSEKEKTAQLV